jgi:hypothetical protein
MNGSVLTRKLSRQCFFFHPTNFLTIKHEEDSRGYHRVYDLTSRNILRILQISTIRYITTHRYEASSITPDTILLLVVTSLHNPLLFNKAFGVFTVSDVSNEFISFIVPSRQILRITRWTSRHCTTTKCAVRLDMMIVLQNPCFLVSRFHPFYISIYTSLLARIVDA